MAALALNASPMEAPVANAGVRAVVLSCLLLSAFALAQTANETDMTITVDERQKAEVYADNDAWRRPEKELDLEAWRDAPPPPVEPARKGRMQFGYESVYDDPRIRRDQTKSTLDLELEQKPSSVFQFKF
jgi:hypothetical protein